MPPELHLPDLPELPLSLGPASPPPGERRVPPPLGTRVRERLSSALPLLLMLALALGTWWLVRNTPVATGPAEQGPARHVPDYTLDRFRMQRFDPAGTLRVVIEGEHLQHFPDDDILQVETIRVTETLPDGRHLVATARQGRARGDGSQIWLDGEAHVVAEQPGQLPVEIRGEHLQAFPKAHRVTSDAKVTVTQGGNRFEADGMIYDHDTRRLTLLGHAHGVYQSRGDVGMPGP